MAFKPEKYEAMRGEVQKLIDIRFIREVRYPQWLANMVMVPKKSTGQCMTIQISIGHAQRIASRSHA